MPCFVFMVFVCERLYAHNTLSLFEHSLYVLAVRQAEHSLHLTFIHKGSISGKELKAVQVGVLWVVPNLYLIYVRVDVVSSQWVFRVIVGNTSLLEDELELKLIFFYHTQIVIYALLFLARNTSVLFDGTQIQIGLSISGSEPPLQDAIRFNRLPSCADRLCYLLWYLLWCLPHLIQCSIRLLYTVGQLRHQFNKD